MTSRNARPVQMELTLDLGLGLDFDTEPAKPAKAPRVTVGRIAQPYDAAQCPICKEWVYIAAGPFAEDNDPTKPYADYLHWEEMHATPEELQGSAIGFPFFDYNDVPVEAVYTIR